jgi:phage terminase large subunit
VSDKLKIKGSEILYRNIASTKRIVINRGGTRSTKSYSISQIAAIWLITGRIGTKYQARGTFSIVRKYFPSLRATTIKDFCDILEELGVDGIIEHNKNTKQFTYDGRVVDYFSVDQETKLRGRKRDHLFVDEANELNKTEWQQLLFRTTGNIYLAFNPSDPNHFIKKELEDIRQYTEKDIEVIVSTYLDNPFLESSIIKEIELLRNTDPILWQVYGNGEWGAIEGLIFNNTNLVDELQGNVIGYGLDFGFSIDPTALVEVRKSQGELYIKTLLYERGLTNADLSKKMNELGVQKNVPIIGDSAEPKSIEELYRDGWRNIKPAQKGKDSVRASIDILRRYKINYMPNDILGTELKTYKYRMDKNLQMTDSPIDMNNHSIDALRYFGLNELNITNKGIYRLR